MANLSDAYGTIKINKVAKEFKEFLAVVQKDAYYLVMENESVELIEPDKNGNAEVDFSTSGRWAYSSNVEGYLGGQWIGEYKEAYEKFRQAMVDKQGSIVIKYIDSDCANDWMGSGTMTAKCDKDGKIIIIDNFDGGPCSVVGFAKLYQYDNELDAMEALHGDETRDAYEKYVEEWKKDHNFVPGREEPAGPDEWFDNEYAEV